jgi:TusA-related sulfurtransferase
MDGTTMIVGVVMLLSGGVSSRDLLSPNLLASHDHQMASCPSAVPGSDTTVAERRDGVVVTVTAEDPAVRGEVRRRAHLQEEAAAQAAYDPVEERSDGQFGFCPGVVQGTQVAVEDLPEGARLTVLGPSPSQVPLLQRMTRKRWRELSATR